MTRVTWEIDVDDKTPVEAAISALRVQRDIHSTATVFTVRSDDGAEQTVDLSQILDTGSESAIQQVMETKRLAGIHLTSDEAERLRGLTRCKSDGWSCKAVFDVSAHSEWDSDAPAFLVVTVNRRLLERISYMLSLAENFSELRRWAEGVCDWRPDREHEACPSDLSEICVHGKDLQFRAYHKNGDSSFGTPSFDIAETVRRCVAVAESEVVFMDDAAMDAFARNAPTQEVVDVLVAMGYERNSMEALASGDADEEERVDALGGSALIDALRERALEASSDDAPTP